MATWSKDRVLQFIELYRSQDCLWKIKSKDYSNRLMKEKAYQSLIDFVKEFEPAANKEFVINKISNLRGAFRKELKKIASSQLSGAGSDEIYRPKLWYYKRLLFLRDQIFPRTACSSLKFGEILETTVIPETQDVVVSRPGSADDLSDIQSLDVEDSVVMCDCEPTPEPRPEPVPRPGQSNMMQQTRKSSSKRKSDDDELYTITCQRLLNPREPPVQDQFDTYGKTMAHKLRSLPREQRILAEKLCNEVMCEAEFGNLTRQVTLSFGTTHEMVFQPNQHTQPSSKTKGENIEKPDFCNLLPKPE